MSQWWKTSFDVSAHTYCCMEQYMMAEKARLFGDEEMEVQILATSDPGKIKALGRKVKGFVQEDWDRTKYQIVLTGNYYKFLQNPPLLDFLLCTGDKILVEVSPYDRVWGIGMGASDENISNPLCWKGKNLLGFALMEVRDELRSITKNQHLLDFEAARAL